MGHKVHPTGLRLGIIRDWQAKWYADKHYAEFLQEDLAIRKAIQERYAEAGISRVEIARLSNELVITIHTGRPGIVIGRGGERVDKMRATLDKLTCKRIRLNIQEIQQPELDAQLVARNVAEQIEHRISYKRAMGRVIARTMEGGAKGVKITCSGRLGGAEIARRETAHDGRVPLHTLRADVDYGFTEARTAMGRIGVKAWIYKGDILPKLEEVEAPELEEEVLESTVIERVDEAESSDEVKEDVATQAGEVPQES